jgi:nitrogen regulatory protein PII
MKKVEAVIEPYKLDAVEEALRGLGINGLTVVEAMGFGRPRVQTAVFRGSEDAANWVRRYKIELIVDDLALDRTLAAIRDAAGASLTGDGKPFVWSIDKMEH